MTRNSIQKGVVIMKKPMVQYPRCIHEYTLILKMVAMVTVVCYMCGCHNPAHDNMEAMMKRAQKQYSPKELQAAIADLCTTNDGYIPVQSLPHEILLLSDTKPSSSYIAQDKAGKRTLMVDWGGEMFSWGIGICPPGGVLLTNMARARIYRWGNGVFFFCEP
jgi:hypothetical protein